MCEMMGQEPDPEQVPVEYSDFPTEIQDVISVYSLLPDNWEPMSGTYMGKNLTMLKDIMSVYKHEHDNLLFFLETIRVLDGIRTSIYTEKTKQRESLKKPA